MHMVIKWTNMLKIKKQKNKNKRTWDDFGPNKHKIKPNK